MEKIINYKKQIVIIAILTVAVVIGLGIYILHTTLNNINYSKSEAHVVALNQFPGTIVSSQIEYENMKIFYEIEVINQAKEHIEISVDAKSGKISGYEYKE